MISTYKVYYKSQIGILKIISSKDSILSIEFVDKEEKVKEIPYILKKAYKQIDEYFKGERKNFDLKLYLEGTDFQKNVWNELVNIPYGETVSYGDIANKIGNKKASRAVGNANNKNKISIVIPCHRVIGSNGKLTGYAGGLYRKEWLLNHEKYFLNK